MAELQSLLLFVNYERICQRSERVVLPRSNPFDDYDEKKFRERFRLSKIAVMKLLEEVYGYDSLSIDTITVTPGILTYISFVNKNNRIVNIYNHVGMVAPLASVA